MKKFIYLCATITTLIFNLNFCQSEPKKIDDWMDKKVNEGMARFFQPYIERQQLMDQILKETELGAMEEMGKQCTREMGRPKQSSQKPPTMSNLLPLMFVQAPKVFNHLNHQKHDYSI